MTGRSVMKLGESAAAEEFYASKLEETFRMSDDVKTILNKFKEFKTHNNEDDDSLEKLLIETDQNDI